jgi:hypothetical protein
MTETIESLRRLPERPISEFEWEDLLLRIELMPRALKVVLEQLGEDNDVVRQVLEALVEREEWAARFLEGAAVHAAGCAQPFARRGQMVILHEDKLDRFVRFRIRNFAMVQRRGIGVWGWSVEAGDSQPATVFQLFTHLAQSDVNSLSTLRGTGHELDVC